MKRSTIPEKLRAPALPSTYLRRPRLQKLWEEQAGHRLLLVTAGAGYGKTSFLAECAQEEKRQVLWYWMDEGDTHFPTFSAHLLELIGGSLPGGSGETRDDDAGLQHRILIATVTALRSLGRVVLILDDAHLLRQSTPSLSFLESVARYLPDQATLVIASREPLAIESMRARATGRAGVVEAADLAFRADEVAALFAVRLRSAALSREQCRRILAATEGWAAGLEIFLQALENPLPAAIDRTLDRLIAAGSGWFDYFAEQVVARLDADTRDFLYRSALLARLDSAICDRILSRSDSARILEDLVRRNLFTLRESVGTQTYRYHHLFHRFLRAWLERHHPAGELRALRTRAARALIDCDAPAEALELLAETGDVKLMIRLLARHGEGLLNSGHLDVIERALSAIAPDEIRRSPEALFVQARLFDDLGRWDAAEATYLRLLKLTRVRAKRVELLSDLATLVSRRGKYRRALMLCKQGLREGRAGGTRARGRLLWTLGVAACELGRLDEGRLYLEKARVLCANRGDPLGEAQADYLLAANVHLAHGDFALGLETAGRALVKLRRLSDPRRVCQAMGVVAWLSALSGDVSEARDRAVEAKRLADSLELPQAASMALHVLGRCSLLEGDVLQARIHLEESRSLGDALGESDARILPRLLLAECALAGGDRAVARKLAGEAVAIAREFQDVLQQAQGSVILGLAFTGRKPPERHVEWTRAERIFRRLGATFDLHRLLLLRLTEEKLSPPVRRRILNELLAASARYGHDRALLAVEPERSAHALVLALAEGIEVERVSLLLGQLGQRAVPDLISLTRADEDGIRLRAVEILSQIGGPASRAALAQVAQGDFKRPSAQMADAEMARAPKDPLRIEALGPLRVRVGTREIPSRQWRSRRARRLFQLLVLRRSRWTPADEVIEALWPETNPEMVRGNLWQSVFQLRRILEPGAREAKLSPYVRVGVAGYRLELGDGNWYDADAFEEAVRRADRLSSAGRQRAAEEVYRQALDLYRGELFAESPYEDYIVSQREHLKELLLRVSHRLISICAVSRRWSDVIPLCRRCLEEDPYAEEAHHQLINAQLQLGHRKEASDSYQQFEKRMLGDLGLLPSSRMQGLAEKVKLGISR